MRRLAAGVVLCILILSGCAAGSAGPSAQKRSSTLPREAVRKHFGAHYELAMILDASEVVRREVRKEISGNKAVHPDMLKDLEALIASFDPSKVQAMLSFVLKEHFTEQEAILLSDHFDGSEGRATVKPVAELLVDFQPRKPGPAPAMKQALGPFASTTAGQKWVRKSPAVQNEFSEMILRFTLEETKQLLIKMKKK